MGPEIGTEMLRNLSGILTQNKPSRSILRQKDKKRRKRNGKKYVIKVKSLETLRSLSCLKILISAHARAEMS